MRNTQEVRPLIAEDCEKRLSKLLEQRSFWYRQIARYEVASCGTPEEVADKISSIMKADIYARILLEHRKGKTSIDVCSDLEAGLKLSPLRGKRAFMVISRRVRKLYPHLERILKRYFQLLGVYELPDGERYKNIHQVTLIHDRMAEAKVTRSDVLIAVGGGVVGDVAGFAASTYMRGIEWIGIPTTLLAQVDSGIGGKTGVNTKRAKNLVGAFWQPSQVISDISFLKTLNFRVFRSGLSEVVKYGAIMDEEFFSYVDKNAEKLLRLDDEVLLEVVTTSAKHKATVVERDEEEKTGYRRILNFGHTFAHVLESAYGYRSFYHGEAVAEGMKVAVRVSERLGIAEKGTGEALEMLLLKLGFRRSWEMPPLERYLVLDKKAEGEHLNFVALRKIGEAEIVKLKIKDLVKCIKEVI